MISDWLRTRKSIGVWLAGLGLWLCFGVMLVGFNVRWKICRFVSVFEFIARLRVNRTSLTRHLWVSSTRRRRALGATPATGCWGWVKQCEDGSYNSGAPDDCDEEAATTGTCHKSNQDPKRCRCRRWFGSIYGKTQKGRFHQWRSNEEFNHESVKIPNRNSSDDLWSFKVYHMRGYNDTDRVVVRN